MKSLEVGTLVGLHRQMWLGGWLSQWPAGTCCFSPYGGAVRTAYPILHAHSRL